MDYKHLDLQRQGACETVTLNRPRQLNALNVRMMGDLGHYFRALADRAEVLVVVLRGAGRAFFASLDLKEACIDAMRRCPQPIISVVQSLLADMSHATPLGLRLTKEAMGHALDASNLEAVLALEDRNQILCPQGEDFLEGARAFLEKREPVFSLTCQEN